MSQFLKAAKKQDVEPGKGILAQVGGAEVAIFNIGGEFFAIQNRCAHRGGPLAEGECEGKIVTCPWHGWQYDVSTGACPDNPKVKVQSYPVKLEGDDVWVEV